MIDDAEQLTHELDLARDALLEWIARSKRMALELQRLQRAAHELDGKLDEQSTVQSLQWDIAEFVTDVADLDVRFQDVFEGLAACEGSDG